MLPGLDHPDGGIHHETARILCAIIADNQYAGFFTEDSAGARRVETPKDGVLQPKNYTSNTTIFIKYVHHEIHIIALDWSDPTFSLQKTNLPETCIAQPLLKERGSGVASPSHQHKHRSPDAALVR
jgi:hypothetical protein